MPFCYWRFLSSHSRARLFVAHRQDTVYCVRCGWNNVLFFNCKAFCDFCLSFFRCCCIRRWQMTLSNVTLREETSAQAIAIVDAHEHRSRHSCMYPSNCTYDFSVCATLLVFARFCLRLRYFRYCDIYARCSFPLCFSIWNSFHFVSFHVQCACSRTCVYVC